MNNANPGLEGVIAAETVLSSVDGERGELIIRGFRVEELAPRATYEEAVYLLWNGRLPSEAERIALEKELGARRRLSPVVLELIRAAARARVPAMDALRTAISALPLGPEGTPDELGVLAAFPSIVAAFGRLSNGAEPIEPDPSLPAAADLLRMLSGTMPSPARVRALNTYLCTTIDHGLNASTFVARAIISTRADLVSAIAGAIGALSGPLHGGAPGPVLDMLEEARKVEDRAAFFRAKLARGERLMGFGHRIYRVRDPRADVLARACAMLAESGDGGSFLAEARRIEDVALRALREHKPDRALSTNVEFYTALLLHAAGIPRELFTALFATSRAAGWIAHTREQLATKKLIRPQSVYVGPQPNQP